jgi:hypothetical protein
MTEFSSKPSAPQTVTSAAGAARVNFGGAFDWAGVVIATLGLVSTVDARPIAPESRKDQTVLTASDWGALYGAQLQVSALQRLQDGWDGEGAPRPSPQAIARAFNVVTWAEDAGLRVSEIDADVLGGVAVWLKGERGDERAAWIACMNSGEDALVLSEGRTVHAHAPWNTDAQLQVTTFLGGNEHAAAA